MARLDALLYRVRATLEGPQDEDLDSGNWDRTGSFEPATPRVRAWTRSLGTFRNNLPKIDRMINQFFASPPPLALASSVASSPFISIGR